MLDRLGAAGSHPPLFGEFDSAARLRCPSCAEGSVRGQNSDVIYPGRVLRFLPPEVEKTWSEARSAHSVAAYTAAQMMSPQGRKALKDRRDVRLAAAASHWPGLPIECPGVAFDG